MSALLVWGVYSLFSIKDLASVKALVIGTTILGTGGGGEPEVGLRTLEDDLNNIVFDYAYNGRHKIGSEDSNLINLVPYLGEHVAPCLIVSQN